MTPTKEDVFRLMCNSTNCFMNPTDLIPSTVMAEHFKCTKYRVRKLLEELVVDGLVESGVDSIYSNWIEQNLIIRGFRLTKKGRDTKTYKQSYEKEMQLVEECFGIKMEI